VSRWPERAVGRREGDSLKMSRPRRQTEELSLRLCRLLHERVLFHGLAVALACVSPLSLLALRERVWQIRATCRRRPPSSRSPVERARHFDDDGGKCASSYSFVDIRSSRGSPARGSRRPRFPREGEAQAWAEVDVGRLARVLAVDDTNGTYVTRLSARLFRCSCASGARTLRTAPRISRAPPPPGAN